MPFHSSSIFNQVNFDHRALISQFEIILFPSVPAQFSSFVVNAVGFFGISNLFPIRRSEFFHNEYWKNDRSTVQCSSLSFLHSTLGRRSTGQQSHKQRLKLNAWTFALVWLRVSELHSLIWGCSIKESPQAFCHLCEIAHCSLSQNLTV